MTSSISDDFGDRGSGRTTRQLRGTAEHGVYIVLNVAMRRYTEHLARSVGRADVRVMLLETASSYGWEKLRGVRGLNAVTLDHACWRFMTKQERSGFLQRQAAGEW